MSHPIHAWRPAGHVYLWRYRENTRNFPGWHLSTDRPGGTALLQLFSLFPSATTRVHRTVPLTPPSPSVLAVPNNQQGNANVWAPTKWRVVFDPALSETDSWEFPEGTDPADLAPFSRPV